MTAPRVAARTFQDLVVWRKAHELVLAVYSFTAGFPKTETYGLALQMRRAAVSVPANIAEGFRRRGKADKARYMNMAEGSLEESLDPGARPWIRRHQQPHNFTGRSQSFAKRLCECDSVFGLLTTDFHIPKGYQGRSPCLVRVRWFLPWLSPRTSIRLPWLRFPKPPYDPGQPVFPGPVQTLAFLRRSSRCQRDLSAGTHAPLLSPVYHRTRPLNEQWHFLAQWQAAFRPMDRQVPRAPLPGGSVTSAGAMSCIASKGVTLSSLLPRAHAPARLPSAYFSLGLVWRIFAGYCQFLLRVGPSRRYLRETLLGCLDLCHGGIRSALARYFLHIVGLPQQVMGRLPTNFHPMTSCWALFSRLQSFLNVQTSKL